MSLCRVSLSVPADNITHTSAKIVDARDFHTGAPIPFEVARGLFLRRVELCEALRDCDYFIKEILEAEDAAEDRLRLL